LTVKTFSITLPVIRQNVLTAMVLMGATVVTTIKDIASAAGVSVSTVSHALTGNRPISEPTRARVLAAVAQLGYRPNKLAQGLVSKTTRSLGLLVPDLANPFFSAMAEALEVQAHGRGYSVILCNTNLDAEREADYLDVLLSRQVDGLLYFPGTSVPNRALQGALEKRIPVVVVDEQIAEVPGVFVDNVDGGRQIGELLAGLGHHRILFLGGAEALPTVQDRLHGLRSALHAAFDGAGAPVDLLLRFGAYRASFGYDTVHACAREGLLGRAAVDAPTAIVAANDLIALGALRALRELSIHVPNECSLVGFDGLEFTMLTTPSLTTVQQPTGLIANSAVGLLIDRIERTLGHREDDYDAIPAPQVVHPVSLVVRESVAAAPGR
jgi:LacI family transcriptional regulator, galactose operon repressor